jgi:hypothetical protein
MTGQTTSWIHLSDFHSGKNPTAQIQQYRYVINHLKSKANTGTKYDFLFVTGDIANKGTDDEYIYYNKHFILPLKNLFPDILYFSIPGNHDLNHLKAPFVYRKVICDRTSKFFYPDKDGARGRSEITPRFSAYISNDLSDFPHNSNSHWLDSELASATYKRTISGVSIGILGLNTAWFSDIHVPDCKRDCDRFHITPGKLIVERGLGLLSECDEIIVLGHHPIDWFHQKDVSAIRTLFGKHNVIYLHGHLHKTMSSLDEGAGFNFRVMQSGAAFQAAEDDIWVNRLLLCDLNHHDNYLDAFPYRWSLDNQDWVPDGEAFPPKYRLADSSIWRFPHSSQELDTFPQPDPYHGWDLIDKNRIKALQANVTKENILGYFDGMLPSLNVGASKDISRRKIVLELTNRFLGISNTPPTITAILGAAGEGKSTVIIQCMIDLVSNSDDWHALYWNSEDTPELSKNLFASLRNQDRNFLIVLDNAGLVSSDILLAITRLLRTEVNGIHFLIADRDTDWRHGEIPTSNNNSKLFSSRLQNNYSEVVLRGISRDDAQKMVFAWRAFGEDGLRELYSLKNEEAIERLIQGAEEELLRSKHEGSLLGALFKVRSGKHLEEHVRDLLEKLSNRSIACTFQGSRTLLDALAYIAAMHSENCLYLTRDVLAEVFRCDLSEITREVLHPLGEEALTDKTGERVLVRHRTIAEIIVNLLLRETGWDIESAICELVVAVEHLVNSGEYLEHLPLWRKMPRYFASEGKKRLAVTLAKLQTKYSPTDSFTQLGLANLYHELEMPHQTVNALLDAPKEMQLNRMATIRAATIFNKVERPICGLLLSWLSLSDAIDNDPPTLKSCKLTLSKMAQLAIDSWKRSPSRRLLLIAYGTSYCFKCIEEDIGLHYRIFPHMEFSETEGVTISGGKALVFTTLRNEISLLYKQHAQDLPKWATPLGDATFIGFSNVLNIPHRYAM